MLQYLSGIGIGKSAKRTEKKENRMAKKQEKKAITVTKKQAQKSKLTPVTKSKINKLQVQSKIRKAFVKKSEPIKVTEEEIVEEVQQPVEEETPTEETETEERAEERESEDADLGIYYPNFGKSKGKLKNAVKKAGAKVKAGVKKSDKDVIAHNIAKVSLILPRGAFLTILALGKALKETPIKLNLAREIVNVWPTKGNQIKKIWYKMGGEPNELLKAINKAENSNLSGNMGVVAAATITTAIATATPIVLKINEILKKGKDFAEKNPKLVAAGNKILKGAIDKAQQKTGVTPEQVDALQDIATTIKKAIPIKATKSVATAEKNITDKDVKTIEQQTTSTIKDNETTTSDGKSNKTIMIVGGVALLGALFLLKRKKNN